MQLNFILSLSVPLLFLISTSSLFASETVHEAVLLDTNGERITNVTLKEGDVLDVVLSADGPQLYGDDRLVDIADRIAYSLYYDKTKLEFISYTRADGPDNTFLTDATGDLKPLGSHEPKIQYLGVGDNDSYFTSIDKGAIIFQGIAYDGDLYDNDPKTRNDLFNDCEGIYLNIHTTRKAFPIFKKTGDPATDLGNYECAGYSHSRGPINLAPVEEFPGTGTSFSGDNSAPLAKIRLRVREGATGSAQLIGALAAWGYNDVYTKEVAATVNIASAKSSSGSIRSISRNKQNDSEDELVVEDSISTIDIDTTLEDQVVAPISPEAVKPISVVCIGESCYPHKEGDAPIELPMGSQTVVTYSNGIDEPTVVYAPPDSARSTSPKGEPTPSLWERVKAFFAPLFWWI